MPRQTPAIGEDVTDLMPAIGADVTDLMGGETPTPARGSVVGEVVGGAAEMLNPITIAKGVYGMLPIPQALGGSGIVEGPVGAVKGIVGSHVDQVKKSAAALNEGRYSEAVGHAGAAVLPILGPAAANIGEEIAQTGNVARGVGKGLGLLAPFAVKPVVGAARGAAARVAPEAAAARLEQGAAARVADVMTPRANTNVGRRMGNKAQKIAPELAKDAEITGNWSRQGMGQSVEAKLADAGAMLDDANDARLSARTFDTQPIIDALEQKRRQYVAEPVQASKITPKETPPSAEAVAEVAGHNAKVAQADRAFALQWMADDLKEMGYQAGGSTRAQRRAAFESWRPGDPEHAKYAIGAGTGRVPGTPTQEMFHALGVKGTRAQIADRIAKHLRGRPDPALDKLGDALVKAFDSETGAFDFARLSDDALEALGQGVKRSDLRSPIVMPNQANVRGDVLARWFPESVDFDQMPMAERAMPEATKTGVPLGKRVTPGPNADRVGMIDQAIAEIRRLGPVARYEDIRTIRQAYDQPAKTVYNPAVTPDFLKVKGRAEGAADVTGALREHLAQWDPQTAAANAQYALYKSASDILKAAEEIERVRPKVGRQIMARLTGTLFGGQHAGVPGAVAGYALGPMVDQLMNAGMTTKLQTAQAMQRLAAAIRRGDLGAATSAEHSLKALLRKAAVSTAQASQTTTPAAYGSPAPASPGPTR